MIDTLLIIGNGFDLYCGLPTKFVDYFNYIRISNTIYDDFLAIKDQYDRDINNFDSKFANFINKYKNSIMKKISIWSLFFYLINENNEDINWFNIEKQMSDSLVETNKEDSFWQKILKLLDNLTLNINRDSHNQSIPIIQKMICMIIKYSFVNEANPHTVLKIDYIEHDNLEYIKNHWQDFLFEQLLLLEKDFKDYIDKIQKDNQFYKINQQNLLEQLLLKSSKSNLMSFNYTSIKNNQKIETCENVHGIAKARSDIIFGIDNTKCNPGDFGYIFTKTYRKVLMYITNPTKTINAFLKKEINNVVFFGHSLNEQDYSYFQTLFDYFNLYDNNEIKIEFRYHVFDSNKKKEIEKNVINGVISLLNIYGKTLDNNYKGANLIHKLLNEKRLLIQTI